MRSLKNGNTPGSDGIDAVLLSSGWGRALEAHTRINNEDLGRGIDTGRMETWGHLFPL